MSAGRPPRADFDVVIAGGGPAGAATALALAQLGKSDVLVLETGRCERVRIGESIPANATLLLDRLGLLDAFVKEDHEPALGSCAAWGSEALGYNASIFSPLGNGWHLNRRSFDLFLARTVAEHGIEVRTGARAESCEQLDDGCFRVRITNGEGRTLVTTRFVVDATGAGSRIARQLGAKRIFIDQLQCVAGFFERTSSGFSKLTMLEAVEYGWWYEAALPDKLLAVVLASDPDIVKHEGFLRRDAWLASLAATANISNSVAGARFVEGSQVVCAAPSHVLDRTAGTGWLAVGDAAAAYDPISSQGICKALSDGIEAASVIAAYLGGSAERLGEWHALRARRFTGYIKTRNFFYGMERRWPNSLFWSRRHAQPALPRTLRSGAEVGSARKAALGHPA